MRKHTVLVVEDEQALLYILSCNLKREGYTVLTAKTGEAGLALARKSKPDFIILDVMLPKMDGMECLRLLRQDSQVPVLFLTAKKSEVDRVLGFKLGGDDYVTKPFSVEELLARVKAILARVGTGRENGSKGPLRMGTMEVDLERHEVRVSGKYRKLAPREFQLLKLLIEAKGKVLSRDHLLEKIWGYDKSMAISTRTVDQHVARLRRKLLAEKERIVTVTNFGYQIRMQAAA